MATRSGNIITGSPGERWTNNTDRAWYQFFATWDNTCGVCAPYDGQIRLGPWPLPLHRNCRCRQERIMPGQESEPFIDWWDKIQSLDDSDKYKLVGQSNWILIEKGVVKWEDVVKRDRIRDFHEVVAIKKLSIKEMVKAGVKPHLAKDAYATVHTPEHEFVAAKRREMAARLENAGMDRGQFANLLASALASRVVQTPVNPSGPPPPPPPTTGVVTSRPPKPLGPQPIVKQSSVARTLGRILGDIARRMKRKPPYESRF